MTDEPKRRIEGLSAEWRGTRGCSYVRQRPSLAYCYEPGVYLVTIAVAASSNRPAYERRRVVCEAHLPRPPRVADPIEPDMIDAQATADLIGINIEALHKWRHRDKGPACVKRNGRYWYRQPDVARYAAAYRIVHAPVAIML